MRKSGVFLAVEYKSIRLSCLFLSFLACFFNFLLNFGPFSSYNSKNNSSIERKTLEKQHQEIEKLTSKIESQENYIKNISNVISGNIAQDSISSSLPVAQKLIQPKLNAKATDSEKKLAEKVKDDLRTNYSGSINDKKNITYFSIPLSGNVLQKFDLLTHPAIDIVTSKDMTIKACLAGTQSYNGIILAENNDFNFQWEIIENEDTGDLYIFGNHTKKCDKNSLAIFEIMEIDPTIFQENKERLSTVARKFNSNSELAAQIKKLRK